MASLDDTDRFVIDAWAEEPTRLRMHGEHTEYRRQFERLLDLIGRSDQSISSSTVRIQHVLKTTSDIQTRLASEPATQFDSTISDPGESPALDLLRADAREAIDQTERTERVHAVLDRIASLQSPTRVGNPLQDPSPNTKRRRWMSDLIAAAAILIAVVSLLPNIGNPSTQFSPTNSVSPQQSTAGIDSIRSLFPPQPINADSFATSETSQLAGFTNAWDVQSDQIDGIEIIIQPDGTASVRGNMLEGLTQDGPSTLRLIRRTSQP